MWTFQSRISRKHLTFTCRLTFFCLSFSLLDEPCRYSLPEPFACPILPRRSSTGTRLSRLSRPSRPRLWPCLESCLDELLSLRSWCDEDRLWCCLPPCDDDPWWWRRSEPNRFLFPESCFTGGGRMFGPSQPTSSSSPSILFNIAFWRFFRVLILLLKCFSRTLNTLNHYFALF